jgi:hypothetical protein
MWGLDENWAWQFGVESLLDYTFNMECNLPGSTFDSVGDGDVTVWWDENMRRINAKIGYTGKNYFAKQREMWVDTAAIAGIQFPENGQEFAIRLALKGVYEKMLPRAIMAGSAAQFESEWSAMVTEMKAEKLDVYMDSFRQLYQERRESWGME